MRIGPVTVDALDRTLRLTQTVALAVIAGALCWIALEVREVGETIGYIEGADTQPIADELDRANDRLEKQDRDRLGREMADPLGLFR